ncbi:MAG: hypothetical protein KAS32_14350 [Candidatus Peribacteraceae bacterium]|nr:hypothetical protein [Candidatus Peribacteraceae bacterium]
MKSYFIYKQYTDTNPQSTIEFVKDRNYNVIPVGKMVEDETYIIEHDKDRVRFIEIRVKASDKKWYTTEWSFRHFTFGEDCEEVLKLFRTGMQVEDMRTFISL